MKEQTSATTETLNKGKTMIDFSGKTIYVGIDMHKKRLAGGAVSCWSCFRQSPHQRHQW